MALIVCCVQTGDRYPDSYVRKLFSMVDRHLRMDFTKVCLSDKHQGGGPVPEVRYHKISPGLTGWWGKMALFSPDFLGQEMLYFDLDTVIVGDLRPLADLDVDFGVCENFTKLSGHPDWPCGYGSCVMKIGPMMCRSEIWDDFIGSPDYYMAEYPRGDQHVIEHLYPDATLLQRVLPEGYLVGRRHFTNEIPPGASVMVFSGSRKPHNSKFDWVKEHWI